MYLIMSRKNLINLIRRGGIGLILLLCLQMLQSASVVRGQVTVSFGGSGLTGDNIINNPTSLMWGPDERLYVSQQNGQIWALNISRNAANDYEIDESESITIVQNMPNHDDDGTSSNTNNRQVTGIYAAGTATNPILYVSSSDPRIGAGGGGNDLGFDTNSGVVSKLTCSGMDANNECVSWSKVDLIRGLPRSEENHATNGLQLDSSTNTLYIAQGGHTNAGAPSNNFAFTIEYAYAAAILEADLAVIEALPTLTDSDGQAYKYNLPTLNTVPTLADLNGSNNTWGTPWGGDDGLNQAMIDPNGPVQIFGSGFRNPYDVVFTTEGNIYTVDNGANGGWGGLTEYEESYDCTNNYLAGEPGSGGSGPDPSTYPGTVTLHDGNNGTVASDGQADSQVNNKNGLHLVTDGYYGGHPNPLRGNPAGAGIYYNGTFYGPGNVNLPSTWPPVPVSLANPVECDFQNSGVDDGTIANYGPSTNGITEYTASNFEGAMEGFLLTASFGEEIYQIELNAAGDGSINCPSNILPGNCNGSDDIFAENFGNNPLDVYAVGDSGKFPGTVWSAVYGADTIYIFEPSDYNGDVFMCTGVDDASLDEDSDNYDNADEIDSGTDPCSGASTPPDNDGDFTSDLNDTDDDNDTLLDTVDVFQLDASNGTTNNLPIDYTMFADQSGPNFFGLGFTGIMANGSDYLTLIDDEATGSSGTIRQIVAGGTAGIFSDIEVGDGDAYQNSNSQKNAFQFGINVDDNTPPFTIKTRVLGNFLGYDASNYDGNLNFASQGIYIGTGDQNNYVKFTIIDGGGSFHDGGFEFGTELNASASFSTFNIDDVPGVVEIMDEVYIDLYLTIDPAAGTIQPKYTLASDPGTITNLGSGITLTGDLLSVLQGNYQINGVDSALAVGYISTSTSNNADPFIANWDFIQIFEDSSSDLDVSTSSIDFGDVQNGDSASVEVTLTNSGGVTSSDISVSAASITGSNSGEFSTDFSGSLTISPGQSETINVTFSPTSIADSKSATLDITHDGANTSPQVVALSGNGVDVPAETVVYRINTGGAQVAAADGSSPDWAQDNNASPSIYFKAGSGNLYNGNGGSAHGGSIVMTHPSLPASAPSTIFNFERYDAGGGDEMKWEFPVTSGETYEVRLFFAELFSGISASGQRVFDVTLEGSVPAAFDDLDAFDTAGAKGAFMATHTYVAGDTTLDLEFIHNVENPAIKGIEIIQLGGNTVNLPPTVDPIADQSSTEGDDVAALGLTVNAIDAEDSIAYSATGLPAGAELEPTNGQFFGTIADGAAANSPYNVTVSVSDGVNTPVTTSFVWTVADDTPVVNYCSDVGGQILYRVNNGGPELADTTAWTEDQATSGTGQVAGSAAFGTPSPYLANLGSADKTYGPNSFSITNATGAPNNLFAHERYSDIANPNNMQWEFPVANGDYTVNLYFAENWSGAATPSVRVFDVNVEGALALDDYDVYVAAGNSINVAVVESINTTVADGIVNIDFVKGAQNPAIKGIEICGVVNSPPTVDPIADQSSTEGDDVAALSLVVNATDVEDTVTYSATGLPTGVTVDPTNGQFSGTIAVGTAANSPYNVTVSVSDGVNAAVTTSFVWTVAEDNPVVNYCSDVSGQVLYRVNNGGPVLTDTTDWTADQAALGSDAGGSAAAGTPSVYLANLSAGDKTFGPGSFTITNATGAPDSLFAQERYSLTANPNNMQWEFPVDNGDYTVNLYFAENWSGAANPGVRVFDVNVEGATALDNYDVYVAAGNAINVAVVESINTTVTDGVVDIDFIKGVQNPAIKGIEICGPAIPAGPEITIDSPTDGDVLTTSDVTVTWSTLGADAISGDHVHLYVDTDVYEDRVTGLPLDGSYTATGLANGPHYIIVRVADVGHDEYFVTDPILNPNAEFRIDFTVNAVVATPTITLTAPISGSILTGDSISVTWETSNTNPGDTVQVSIEGQAPITGQATAGSLEFNALSAGDFTFICEIVDSNGDVYTDETATDSVDVTLEEPEAETVLYRVNAGGPALAAADASAPDWSIDTGGATSPTKSPYLVAGSNYGISTHNVTIDLTDPSVAGSAAAVQALFQKERWDNPTAPEMAWAFPVTAGETIELRLYFAETYDPAQFVGGRIFDVEIEGTVPAIYDDVQPYVLAGETGDKAIMLPYQYVATDDTLNIVFLHGAAENSAVKAIEVVQLGEVETNPAALMQVNAGAGLSASTFGGGSLTIENTGDQDIVGVTVNIGTSLFTDIVFDPTGTAGDATAKCLTADGGSAAPTGFVAPADPCVDPFSQPNNGVDGDEGYDVMSMSFTDFNPGETFSFSVDIDPTSIREDATAGNAGSVSGLELSGSIITVDFADGSSISANLFEEGSLGGSNAVIAPDAPAAPTLDLNGINSTPVILPDANQVLDITGPANATVTVLHVDGHLYIDAGQPNPGYDIDPFEANSAVAVNTYSVVLDAAGAGTLPVTLLQTAVAGAGPDGRFNHFIAVVEGTGDQNSQTSNLILVEYDPTAVNTAPVVTISAPADNSVGNEVVEIEFVATALDSQEGDLTADISWVSDIDGPLGTGGTVSATLSVGTHVISATVTDNNVIPLTGTDTITIDILSGAANLPPTLVNPGNQINAEGQAIALQITATPPEIGQTLVYSATGLPLGLSIDENTGVISGVLEEGTPGSTLCVEQGGFVVVEFETIDELGDWSDSTDPAQIPAGDVIAGASGSYYEWKFGNTSQAITGSGQGILSYPVEITTPGLYEFKLRSWSPNPGAEYNDVWIRVQGAGSSSLAIKGSVNNPTSTTQLGNNWFKGYDAGQSWTWAISNVDFNAHNVYMEFDTAGVYQVEFSGRSNLYKMDRFVLHDASVSYNESQLNGLAIADCTTSPVPGAADGSPYNVQVTVTDDGTPEESTQVNFDWTVGEAGTVGSPAAELSVNDDAGLFATTFGANSFSIENTGDIDIVSVEYDLSAAMFQDMVFDPVGTAGDINSKCLDVTTGATASGLTTPTGGTPTNVSNPACVDPFSQPHNGVDNGEGFDKLTLEFTDFNQGETVQFAVDMDPTSIKEDVTAGNAGAVSGLEIIGTKVTITFADGSVIVTSLVADVTDGESVGVAALPNFTPSTPSISVQGVLNTPTTVSDLNQTILIDGPPNATVKLLRVDARLYLDPGTPAGGGYDIDPFEANEALAKQIYTVTLDEFGVASVPVVMTETASPNAGPDGGINHFIAAVVDGTTGQTSLPSNVVILEYEETTFVLGDVSCDGQVNTIDALFILQFDAALRTASPVCPLSNSATQLHVASCDVSGDNTCNTVDALFILQCDAGLNNLFCPAIP